MSASRSSYLDAILASQSPILDQVSQLISVDNPYNNLRDFVRQNHARIHSFGRSSPSAPLTITLNKPSESASQAASEYHPDFIIKRTNYPSEVYVQEARSGASSADNVVQNLMAYLRQHFDVKEPEPVRSAIPAYQPLASIQRSKRFPLPITVANPITHRQRRSEIIARHIANQPAPAVPTTEVSDMNDADEFGYDYELNTIRPLHVRSRTDEEPHDGGKVKVARHTRNGRASDDHIVIDLTNDPSDYALPDDVIEEDSSDHEVPKYAAEDDADEPILRRPRQRRRILDDSDTDDKPDAHEIAAAKERLAQLLIAREDLLRRLGY